jgi:excisionase family DNA binding protein
MPNIVHHLDRATATDGERLFLTAAQAERRYSVNRFTLYRWAAERRIPSIKMGRTVRFNRETLDAHFAAASRAAE